MFSYRQMQTGYILIKLYPSIFKCFNVQMFKCSKVSTQLHPRSCTSLGCNSDIMDCMISTNCSLAVFCFTLSSVSASQWQKKHILDVVKTILVLHNYNTAKSKSTVLAFFSMVFHLQSVCTSVPVYQCTSVIPPVEIFPDKKLALCTYCSCTS